jgi:hypothetical protein
MLRERTATLVLLALGGLALLSIVAAQDGFFGRVTLWGEAIGVGLLFGSFFGLVAVAAAWTVYGWRWPGLILCVPPVLAMVANGAVRGVGRDNLAGLAVAMSVAATSQFVVIAALLWPLLAFRGARLRHVQTLSADELAAKAQFGIRDLLVAIAVAAVLLAAIRWIVAQPWPNAPQHSIRRDLLVLGFVAVCNTLVSMPLLIAPLLRRFALATTIAALAFAVFVTACEVSAWISATGQTLPFYEHRFLYGFAAINAIQAFWILAVLGTLRAAGWRLVGRAGK